MIVISIARCAVVGALTAPLAIMRRCKQVIQQVFVCVMSSRVVCAIARKPQHVI